MEAFTTTPELVGILMECAHMSNEPRATLANCARVNRCFSNEALRVLWRELPSLHPFLELLPRDIKTSLMDSHGDGERVLINPSDWDKVLYYAPFVRKLNYSLRDKEWLVGTRSLDPFITEAFQAAFPSRVLLPNLLVLVYVRLDSQRSLSLLSPSIQTLDIIMAFIKPDPDRSLVVEAIQRMTSLDVLRWSSYNVSLDSNLGEFLDGKDRLRELTLTTSSVTWEQLYTLQGLSNLEKLSFNVQNMEIPTAELESFRFSLPRLRELSIIGENHVVAQLIQVVQLRPREVLIIKPTPSQSAHSYTMLFDAIGCLPIEALRKLEVSPDIWRQLPRIQNIVLERDTLRPILKFSQLTHLVLQLEIPIDLCDSDIPGILRAFPGIREITMVGARWLRPVSEPRLSPLCLLTFAREAPQLRVLGIHINQNWQDLGSILPQSFHSTSCLETLNVSSSKLVFRGGDSYSESDVSAALARFFPRLTRLRFRGEAIASHSLGHRTDAYVWVRVRNELMIEDERQANR